MEPTIQIKLKIIGQRIPKTIKAGSRRINSKHNRKTEYKIT